VAEPSLPPPVNPDVNDIADRAKYAYAAGTKVLAALHYRLAELARSDRINPDESISLQCQLQRVWEALYYGTTCAVRDEDTDDSTWDEADNTYSDGRQVMIQTRIEPHEQSDFCWEHNRFVLGDGAVNEYPLGTVSYILPIDPREDRIPESRPHELPTNYEDLRLRLLQLLDADDADAAEDGGEDES
jgi:hypothetical protein